MNKGLLGLISLLAIGAFAGCRSHETGSDQPHPGAESRPAATPVVSVETVPLERGTLSELLTAYGTVIPAPGAIRSVSVPFESQVSNVWVSNGQDVAEGDLLLEIRPSPSTLLSLQQARASSEVAKESLQHVQDRFRLQLATNDQVLTARQALLQAELSLKSLLAQGVEGDGKLKAPVSGLIRQVHVGDGALVAGGAPMVDLVIRGKLEIQLGVEREDVSKVRPAQPIRLNHVESPGGRPIRGKIRKISQAVNPATRLVDVFVTPTSPENFFLSEFVVGAIPVVSSSGWIVPRSAVLPRDGRQVVFTVKDGRARRHLVQVGLESDRETEVISEDLSAGDEVVVLGNYQLRDGMLVRRGKAVP